MYSRIAINNAKLFCFYKYAYPIARLPPLRAAFSLNDAALFSSSAARDTSLAFNSTTYRPISSSLYSTQALLYIYLFFYY